MKKILLITAFMPSRFSGGAIFTLNLLNDLSRDYYIDVLVITREKIKSIQNYEKNITVIYINKFWVLFKIVFFFFLNPLFINRFSLKILLYIKKCIKQNNYDLIYFDYSQVFLYSLFFKLSNKVLNYHDVIVQKFLREKFPLSILSIPSYIFELLFSMQKNTYFITPTEKDSLLLKKFYNQNSKHINHYLNDYILSLNNITLSNENYFVFFGDWSRSENEEGLIWFLQNIKNYEISDHKFLIIGKDLNAKLKVKLPQLKNIEYLGFVDNPYDIISKATAIIAPVFRGAGIKIKVVESLACGTPVLGTRIAFEGLPVGFEKYLVLCESIEDYFSSIKSFSLSNMEKNELRENFIKIFNQNTAGSYIRNILTKN
jgi:glycosyltransferase involved in cell wall biosynthesis